MNGSPAVETTRLAKRFGTLEAVRDLSLVIGRGEMFSLVGPDGAGKSTILRMLCGVLKPDGGSARVLGFDLRRDIGRIKERIGYFSQRFSLYGDLSVDENIEFFAEIHQVRNYRARREELLEFTRLTSFRTRLAEQLSGGMKQKLALACTLIHTPEVIFLDEPTTGVDPVSRRDFWVILADLLRQGVTIVMTTPYLDEAERSTRVGLLNQGRLMVADAPARVRSGMRGRVFEVVCPEVRRARDIVSRMPEVTEVQLFGDRLNAVVREGGGDFGVLVRSALTREGILATGVRAIPASLENVFISMLKAS
jgi:ABC-2 type transport system ATP-binding protein